MLGNIANRNAPISKYIGKKVVCDIQILADIRSVFVLFHDMPKIAKMGLCQVGQSTGWLVAVQIVPNRQPGSNQLTYLNRYSFLKKPRIIDGFQLGLLFKGRRCRKRQAA